MQERTYEVSRGVRCPCISNPLETWRKLGFFLLLFLFHVRKLLSAYYKVKGIITQKRDICFGPTNAIPPNF